MNRPRYPNGYRQKTEATRSAYWIHFFYFYLFIYFWETIKMKTEFYNNLNVK